MMSVNFACLSFAIVSEAKRQLSDGDSVSRFSVWIRFDNRRLNLRLTLVLRSLNGLFGLAVDICWWVRRRGVGG
jgi:hypothetical protein